MKTKLTRKAKKPVAHLGRFVFEDPTRAPIKLRAWVLPDHWDQDAPRWVSAHKRGWLILTRTQAARLARRWREEGSPGRGCSDWFTGAALVAVRAGLERYGKEVAA